MVIYFIFHDYEEVINQNEMIILLPQEATIRTHIFV